jgi:hypothetical protein
VFIIQVGDTAQFVAESEEDQLTLSRRQARRFFTQGEAVTECNHWGAKPERWHTTLVPLDNRPLTRKRVT